MLKQISRRFIENLLESITLIQMQGMLKLKPSSKKSLKRIQFFQIKKLEENTISLELWVVELDSQLLVVRDNLLKVSKTSLQTCLVVVVALVVSEGQCQDLIYLQQLPFLLLILLMEQQLNWNTKAWHLSTQRFLQVF